MPAVAATAKSGSGNDTRSESRADSTRTEAKSAPASSSNSASAARSSSGGSDKGASSANVQGKASATASTTKSRSSSNTVAAATRSGSGSSKSAAASRGKAEPSNGSAKPSAVAAATKTNPTATPATKAADVAAGPAKSDAPADAKAVAAIDKGAASARLPAVPAQSAPALVTAAAGDVASAVRTPQSAFAIAPQCVVTPVVAPPPVADRGPAITVEIASSDANAAVVDDDTDNDPAADSASAAGSGAGTAPQAALDKRPPGPGVVPPDVLAFALRSHALYPVVPVSVTLAQWAKESGWSLFMPPNSNNPFGIKCYDPDKGCSGAKTAEQDAKGKQSIITAKFQKFDSMADAFVNHDRILATLSVYDPARNASDIDGFARGLKAYATDIDYTASLIRDYLKPYNLYKYDECENAIAAW